MKGSIQKYKTKQGIRYRYTVDISTDGKRKQKKESGFIRKKDAELALRKLLSQIDEGSYVEASNESFSTFLESWFTSHYMKRIKVTTHSNRKYLVEKHLIRENPFAQKALSKITTEDIDSFYNLKIDEGYSTSYIKKMHQMLSLSFSQAIKWKKIAFNPVLDADPPSVKTEEVKIWSKDQINTFLNECKDERLYIFFLLAIFTGMRKGELLGLRWSDIDYLNQAIQVNRTLSYIQHKGYLFTSPKTVRSKRSIPISKLVLNELRKHKDKQEEWKSNLGTSYQDQGLVICTDFGSVQDPRNVLRTMKRIIKKAGVTEIRIHDLRHTHASILISEGIDIVKVAARLGHSSPKTTLGIYAHLVPNNDNDVADVFENAIQPPVTDL